MLIAVPLQSILMLCAVSKNPNRHLKLEKCNLKLSFTQRVEHTDRGFLERITVMNIGHKMQDKIA
jgi:hypothetical protein